jgi:hypothetical protein
MEGEQIHEASQGTLQVRCHLSGLQSGTTHLSPRLGQNSASPVGGLLTVCGRYPALVQSPSANQLPAFPIHPDLWPVRLATLLLWYKLLRSRSRVPHLHHPEIVEYRERASFNLL